ncbi:MAG: hypothetical protein ACK40G_15885 [Cytophagaceae bacterium]
MKKIFLAIILLTTVNFSFAQLSTRENNPGAYKIGVRPVAGDYGLFLAVDNQTVGDWIGQASGNDDEGPLEVNGFRILNFRYYKTDEIVYRIGVWAEKDKRVSNGQIYYSTTPTTGQQTSARTKESVREYAIVPGVERHFKASNWLDTYIGAEILFGTRMDVTVENQEFQGGDYSKYSRRGRSIMYGLGAFAGLQAFVADLPLSVGVEWGLLGKGHLREKYKVTEESQSGGTSTSNKYYIAAADRDDAAATQYSKLNARSFLLQNQVRFIISYYFSK